LSIQGGATEPDGHTLIATDRSGGVSVDGPATRTVTRRLVRLATDNTAEIRNHERDRVRAMGSTLARRRTNADAEVLGAGTRLGGHDGSVAAVRPLLVHVPPGHHEYEIRVGGTSARLAAWRTSAFLRLEDAIRGSKDERAWAADGRAACNEPGFENSCLIGLAFAGEDFGPRFEQAVRSASEAARNVARIVGGGAPQDLTLTQESEASLGEPSALAAVARDAAATIDPTTREAWARGTLRGTAWETVETGGANTWFAMGAPGEACSNRADLGTGAGEREVRDTALTASTVPWRHMRMVRLVAVAPCDAKPPMRVEVDGRELVAEPSGPRALWRVVVAGETARIRRLDSGPGHLYLLGNDECGGGAALMHAASPLTAPRTLTYAATTTAPGLEAWLRDGTTNAAVTLSSVDGHERLDLTLLAGGPGLVALDEQAGRWRRVGHVSLPTWATHGVIASGTGNVAVRAVARAPKSSRAPSTTIEYARAADVAAVSKASRKLLAARSREDQAEAALERALLLAAFGAGRAALSDAELARDLGGRGPGGEDPTTLVTRAVRPTPPKPSDAHALPYGLESDFDPQAPRCAVGTEGPRARVAAVDVLIRSRRESAGHAVFERTLAVQAAEAALAAPDDPRSATLLTEGAAGSRWRLVRNVDGGSGRIPHPHDTDRDPLVDGDGRLRVSLLAGEPFGASFVSVTPERPARAVLELGGAKARLDLVCVPRHAAAAERCPLKVRVGDTTMTATVGDDGSGSVEVPATRMRGPNAELELSILATPADFAAVVRVVLDRPSRGTREVAGVGWVLETPHVQHRFLVTPGRPIRIRPTVPGLVRVDALAEGGSAPEVVCSVGGRDIPISTRGEPRVIPVTTPGDMVIAARAGTASLAIAERVEIDARALEADEEAARRKPGGDTLLAGPMSSVDAGGWRTVAESSRPPPTWLEDRLGTFETVTGAGAGTLREGARADTAPDTFVFEDLSYRRRVESVNLFTMAGATVRMRDGAPTYGATATLYEDVDAARLRIMGTASAFSQRLGTDTELTLRPRAFVEYSARLAHDVFLLPRLGYDGYYTTLAAPPASSRGVDDDVYNAFRFKRNTFLFAQGLFWYAPFFNDIFYLRARGTFDASSQAFSHASLRPGAFLIFRTIELATFLDAQYFASTPGARSGSGVDLSAGEGVIVHLPVSAGSFEIRPSATGAIRTDGGWQVLAGLSLVASFHRGVRDYSSLELAFPEETSGGIPWRNAGHYR
jgi:hypothetical protein